MMTSEINKSVQQKTFERVAREQLDAFEAQERHMRAEERAARAGQLKLPIELSTRLRERKGSPHQSRRL